MAIENFSISACFIRYKISKRISCIWDSGTSSSTMIINLINQSERITKYMIIAAKKSYPMALNDLVHMSIWVVRWLIHRMRVSDTAF